MSGWEIAGGIIMILLSIALVFLVLLQEGTKDSGISSLTGGDGSYYNKNQGRTRNAMLFRVTKFCSIAFFLVVILTYAAANIGG